MIETKAERNKRIKVIRQIMHVLRAEYGSELTAKTARELLQIAVRAADLILNMKKEAQAIGGPMEGA